MECSGVDILLYFLWNQLYVSRDLATSWQLVHDMVNSRFYWAVPEFDSDLTTVHMECEDPLTG